MPPPYRFPRAKDPGKRVWITGKTWNKLVSELEAARNISAAAPLTASVGPDSTSFALLQGTNLRIAKTDGSGIAAATSEASPTTGTVTVYRFNGTGWVATTNTLTVHNIFSGTNGAVGANKLVLIGRDTESGKWVVLVEICS